MYMWSIKSSYSFMEGHHNELSFWLKLPYYSFLIAYKTIYIK